MRPGVLCAWRHELRSDDTRPQDPGGDDRDREREEHGGKSSRQRGARHRPVRGWYLGVGRVCVDGLEHFSYHAVAGDGSRPL